MSRRRALIAALAAAGISSETLAVRLNPDGLGQALIYPYYTVQSSEGNNSWNTYLSVVNHSGDVKALRVRFREGRNGRNVGNLNLYLSPNDVWTGAIVPSDQDPKSVARIITADASCTYPRLPAAGETFTNVGYTGSLADGLGDGLDRTREGYIEIIEMASFTGGTVAGVAVTHVAGVPDDCSVVQSPNFDGKPDLQAPTGGLSGTLTLINVNSGMDAGMNAIALEGLANKPFFRGPDSDYPGFSAAEILPVSTVRAGGKEYDLKWKNGVDAVSSVFMASEVLNEFVLDPQTASQTDWVITFPTRPYSSLTTPPFMPESLDVVRDIYDREGRSGGAYTRRVCGFQGLCRPTALAQVAGAIPIVGEDPTSSLLGGLHGLDLGAVGGIGLGGPSGWMRIRTDDYTGVDFRMRSEDGSRATDLATGAVTTGRFELFGLPWTGFMVRTFKNGTLTCASGACQGNYAGSFPHRYVRTITQIP